jgi:uncharacterized protein DUF2249
MAIAVSFNEGANESEIHVDARPLLAAGQEPFSVLMAAAGRVALGGLLIVDAPFDLLSLKRLLGGRGFGHETEELGPNHFRVCFRRAAVAPPSPLVSTDSVGARVWREADGVHIDVRGLSPPNPMVAILRLLEQPDCGDVVFVHHEREPVFLFPELTQRGWSYRQVSAAPPELRYRLTRGTQ